MARGAPDGLNRYLRQGHSTSFLVYLNLISLPTSNIVNLVLAYSNHVVWLLSSAFPEALDIVGIASQPVRPNAEISEDLLYLDARVWSEELDSEASRLQQKLGIFTSATPYSIREQEYPVSISTKITSERRPTKVGRNERCPCGSGKKYKRRHGRFLNTSDITIGYSG
jgi:hypothetical protein